MDGPLHVKKTKSPVDGGWGWVIVFGHFMNLFFMVGIAKSIGILLDEFHTHFQVSMAMSATVMSVCGIAYAAGSPVCILLGERFSARTVVMVGGFIGFIGMSVCWMMFSMLFIIMFFGISFGIGNAAIYGNGLVILGRYFEKRRSLAIGMALAGSSIGQFAMPPLIQYMLETYSLGGTLLLLGGLYFHVTLFASLFRPFPGRSPKTTAHAEEQSKFIDNNLEMEKLNGADGGSHAFAEVVTEENGTNCDKASSEQDRQLYARMASTGSIYLGSVDCLNELDKQHYPSRVGDVPKEKSTLKKCFHLMFDMSVLRSYICIFYTAVSFFGFFGQFNFVIFLPSYALTRGVTKYNKAVLVSICGICDLAGRLGFGYIADLKIIQRYKIKSLCLICLGLNTFMFAFSDTFLWIAIHSGLYGVFGGGFVGMLSVVLIDFVGLKPMPKYLAVVLLFQGIGAAAGQPLLGFIRDYTGNYIVVVYLCGACSLFAGCILLFWPIVRRLENRRLGKSDSKSILNATEILVNS